MRAHVLSIGSELILGHLTDTNATYLAQELVAVGIELLHVTQVGDDRARLSRTLGQALAEADAVICTGGVGPTDDDLTREAIADVVGETPEIDPDLLTHLRAYFAGRGISMPERNAKQAWLIPSAEALPNPVGTAPGWCVRHDGKLIFAMPGVPREMFRMWREQVLPRLLPHQTARSVKSVTLKTLGIGESAAEQLLDDLVKQANPVVATYAKDDGVHIRITGIAGSDAAAIQLRDVGANAIRRRLSTYIYAEDNASLASVLLDGLRARDCTLGIVEHGTGGRLATLLLTEPSADAVVRGALALPTSSRAPDAAGTLASQALEAHGASLGLGLTAALQATDQGQFEGTVSYALAGKISGEESGTFRAAFAEVQRRAALSAADFLRRALKMAG